MITIKNYSGGLMKSVLEVAISPEHCMTPDRLIKKPTKATLRRIERLSREPGFKTVVSFNHINNVLMTQTTVMRDWE